jgi:hypothetical protein
MTSAEWHEDSSFRMRGRQRKSAPHNNNIPLHRNKKKEEEKKANICPSGSDMNSWCRWTHPRTKHDDLRFQCVTHIRVRVGFSHVLVFFFLFCDVVGELRNHCCWRLLFLLHHRKRKIRHCRPKIGAKNKREKRGGFGIPNKSLKKNFLLLLMLVYTRLQ